MQASRNAANLLQHNAGSWHLLMLLLHAEWMEALRVLSQTWLSSWRRSTERALTCAAWQ